MSEQTNRVVPETSAFGKLLRCIRRDAEAGINIREKYHRQLFYDPDTQSLLRVSVNKKGGVSADITFGVKMLV